MPYIRVELDVRTDPRWATIPSANRAKAKALYLDAVSYSGELLTNGHVSRAVLGGLASEIGIERPQKLCNFLVATGHLSVTETGYFVNEWEQFHDSREKVQQRRLDAAKRKQRSRAQTSPQMSHRKSRRDKPAMSQRDKDVTSQTSHAIGHTPGHTVEVEPEEDLTKAVDLHHSNGRVPEPEPPLDDEPTAQDLEYLHNLDPLRSIP